MKNYDVVIAGYGLSGALAAYWCSRLGLSCCVLEKKPYAGGISVLAGGEVRCSSDADKTFTYLKQTNNGTIPDDVLRSLADVGVLREDVDQDLLRLIGLGALNWVATWFREDGRYSLEEIGDFVWRVIRDAVLKD